MKKSILLFFLVFGASIVQAQSLNHANRLFEDLNYTEAAKVYEDYLAESEELEIEPIKKAADSYYFINEDRNALKWYGQLYELQGDKIEDKYLFRYIQSLRSVRDYEKANELTKVYLNRKENPEEIDLFLAQKRRLDSLQNTKTEYSIGNLDINSQNSDFGAAFYGDKVVYSSSKSESSGSKLYIWNKQPFLDLYVADRNEDGSLSNEKPFISDISSRYHDATIAFSESLDTIYYTTNIRKNNRLFKNDGGVNNFHIMRGIIKDGELESTESLFFNSTEYSVGHPALSDDGKLLFFVSDMPGGYGETDIYVVEVFQDGTMNSPKNLGSTINTEGREMFPFYHNNNLYFSSDGHYGLGGLDVFKSNMETDFTFSVPKNLGPPVNSNKDDFSFILDPETGNGYMSSNRSGGKGDDDIYLVNRECRQVVMGTVVNAADETALENATVKVFDESKNEIEELKTNSQGEFSISLPCNKEFTFTAKADNFTSASKTVNTLDVHKDTIKGIVLALSAYDDLVEDDGEEEKIKVDPIYFEFDKARITELGAKELEKVIYVLTEFPEVKIKIESHTDARGTDTYNLKLSQARAESTKDYLLSHGISESRIISAKGYGEIDIINQCKNEVDCTEEEHQENRRSDFIIVAGPNKSK